MIALAAPPSKPGRRLDLLTEALRQAGHALRRAEQGLEAAAGCTFGTERQTFRREAEAAGLSRQLVERQLRDAL